MLIPALTLIIPALTLIIPALTLIIPALTLIIPALTLIPPVKPGNCWFAHVPLDWIETKHQFSTGSGEGVSLFCSLFAGLLTGSPCCTISRPTGGLRGVERGRQGRHAHRQRGCQSTQAYLLNMLIMFVAKDKVSHTDESRIRKLFWCDDTKLILTTSARWESVMKTYYLLVYKIYARTIFSENILILSDSKNWRKRMKLD